MILLCTDLHLDEQRTNDYRWRVFDDLERACREYPVERVCCLGDVTDRRDRFPAEMVNRFVARWKAVADILLARVGGDYPLGDDLVDILDGNHTRLLGGGSFWEFVSEIPGLSYVTRPTSRDDGRLLLLPFSPNPREEWRGLVTGAVVAVFLHATRSGTIAENGHELRGQELPPIPGRVRVYSGDVHNQQVVGNWTYVGAPFHIKYGDSYSGRFLLLNENTYEIVKEIAVNSLSRRIVEISSVDDLSSAVVDSGDQVKVRVAPSLAAGDLGWAAVERAVDEWARSRGVEVATIEGGYEVPNQGSASTEGLSPQETLCAFAEREGVSGARLDLGIELLGLVNNE